MGRNWTGRKHRCMEKKTITIITPWLNSPELIPTYIASVKGADVEVLHDRAHGDVYAHAVKGS